MTATYDRVPAPAPLALRVCVALSMAHACIATAGIYLLWFISRFVNPQVAASIAWQIGFWFVVSWPLWWIACIVVKRGHWRSVVKSLKTATLIWLTAAIPTLVFLVYLGLYFLSWRIRF
ncbi:MAG: hypothetical protein ACREPN_13000 [Rudaea sp.]